MKDMIKTLIFLMEEMILEIRKYDKDNILAKNAENYLNIHKEKLNGQENHDN